MMIDYDYKQVKVPYEILEYCDHFTYDAVHEDLRYLDCIYMNMGYYGNDPEHLEKMRKRVIPIFE